MKRMYKKGGNGKNRKRTIAKKIKKAFLIGMIGFFVVGIAINSTQFNGYKDSVYATLKDQYIIPDQTTEVVEVEENTVETTVKNLTLTLDMDLRTPSNVTAEEVDEMLEGTNLYGLGKAFVEAEQKYSVNALYMIGLACLESSYGTSKYATMRNNLYGWNAIDSNPDNASYFASKEEATLYVASKLQKNYLSEDGVWFEGYDAKSIDKHYCTDTEHAQKIVNIVAELTKKLG